MTTRFPIEYDSAYSDSRGATRGARALQDWIIAEYHDLKSLGIYNYRPIRGSTSLSIHAEGRAIDIGWRTTVDRTTGNGLADRLWNAHGDLGIQSIIWWERIASNHRSGSNWRPYTGTNPHRDHLHIELTRAAAAALTAPMIADTLGGHTPMPTQPDRTAQVLRWQRALIDAGYADTEAVTNYADGDFGDQTLDDSLRALADLNELDANPDAVRKAALLDRVLGTWRELHTEAEKETRNG